MFVNSPAKLFPCVVILVSVIQKMNIHQEGISFLCNSHSFLSIHRHTYYTVINKFLFSFRYRQYRIRLVYLFFVTRHCVEPLARQLILSLVWHEWDEREFHASTSQRLSTSMRGPPVQCRHALVTVFTVGCEWTPSFIH